MTRSGKPGIAALLKPALVANNSFVCATFSIKFSKLFRRIPGSRIGYDPVDLIQDAVRAPDPFMIEEGGSLNSLQGGGSGEAGFLFFCSILNCFCC